MSGGSPPNYTDGVPVKISERFKPPPEIHLTTKLVQQLSRTRQNPVAFDDYNFDLERKIISKTTEWINYRLKEKTERQQRIHQRELARQKRFEEEQKVKLNQVSYPSADELTSSCDEEEEEERSNEATSRQQQPSIPSEKLFCENFNSNTILMPTQAMPDMASAAATTATNNGGSSNKKSHHHRRYASNSSNKIDFSFFESDTSPFDHLEMKSMNEMEELSKILQSTAVDVDDSSVLERNNSSESEPSEGQQKVTETNNNINTLAIEENARATQPQQIQSSYAMQGYSQQVYNNYYYPTPAVGQNQSYQFAAASTPPVNQNFAPSPYAAMGQPQHLPNYYTQNYVVNHANYHIMGHQQLQQQHHFNNNNNTACEDFSDDKLDVAKSKSVPDIIKELNDELNNSERRRIRNNSQNSHKNVVVTQQHEDERETKSASLSEQEDQFSKLSPKSQAIAKQVSQMGFDRDMVIRVLNRIGDNDKKIVEHLISLSELLQMGFDENLVSEALVKFDNNKDRALDFLIS